MGVKKVLVLTLILFTVAEVQSASACSRALWNSLKDGMSVGRNIDWLVDTKSNLWFFPAGMHRDGAVDKNSLKWKSRYASLVISIYDAATADGLNEAGLNVNMLYLAEAEYGERNTNVPGMSASIWTQFYLDNFATVAEAVLYTRTNSFQIESIEFTGLPGTAHLSMADASGDSAVIEVIGGKFKIYHDRAYTIMTNSPPFDEQLENLRQYKGFGGEKDLPGYEQAADRFVRAAKYLAGLPNPTNKREKIAYLFSVMRNVASPFEAVTSTGTPDSTATRWRAVQNLKELTLYFESTISPNIIWVDSDNFDSSSKGWCLKIESS